LPGVVEQERQGRNLTPWLGGLVLGALIAGAAVFMLKGEKAGAERDVEGGKEVNQNIPHVNLNQSLAPQASETPTPRPTVNWQASNSTAIERGVRACLDGWIAATRAHDFEAHMSFYAVTLAFYYRRSDIGVAIVRSDRARLHALHKTRRSTRQRGRDARPIRTHRDGNLRQDLEFRGR
jgi:hypothetical protein